MSMFRINLATAAGHAMLDIDSSRIGAAKIADRFFVERRSLVGILCKLPSNVCAFCFSPNAASFLASFWGAVYKQAANSPIKVLGSI